MCSGNYWGPSANNYFENVGGCFPAPTRTAPAFPASPGNYWGPSANYYFENARGWGRDGQGGGLEEGFGRLFEWFLKGFSRVFGGSGKIMKKGFSL